MKNKQTTFYSLMYPAFFHSIFIGASVGAAITLFKFCARYVMARSEEVYALLRQKPLLCFPTILILALCAALSVLLHKKVPNSRGGGIPTSIAILRGRVSFRWLDNVLAVFGASLLTFFIGVPLGNEGPSVQIGTAMGRGATRLFPQKYAAWDRCNMTAGSCAGFSAATNAPVSGMMFAIEEAHQRITPSILLVTITSVASSKLMCEFLCPLLGVPVALFDAMPLPPALGVSRMWLPLVIGAVVGLFSVLFLKYYEYLNHVWVKTLSCLPHYAKILIIYGLSLGLGLISYSFLSSGHHLIHTLMEGYVAWYLLLGFLVVRSTVMILASSTGITGGMFLPIMTLGALISSLLGSIMAQYTPLGESFYPFVVALGITACIAGMMKTPLTAVVFAVEALSCADHILPTLVCSATAFFVTEVFSAESINDHVLHNRMEQLAREKEATVIDLFVTVQPKAYAIGRLVRDIFWPSNLFVLSVKHTSQNAEMDERGDDTLRQGDLLHVRYSTFDNQETLSELLAIVGRQEVSDFETVDLD